MDINKLNTIQAKTVSKFITEPIDVQTSVMEERGESMKPQKFDDNKTVCNDLVVDELSIKFSSAVNLISASTEWTAMRTLEPYDSIKQSVVKESNVGLGQMREPEPEVHHRNEFKFASEARNSFDSLTEPVLLSVKTMNAFNFKNNSGVMLQNVHQYENWIDNTNKYTHHWAPFGKSVVSPERTNHIEENEGEGSDSDILVGRGPKRIPVYNPPARIQTAEELAAVHSQDPLEVLSVDDVDEVFSVISEISPHRRAPDRDSNADLPHKFLRTEDTESHFDPAMGRLEPISGSSQKLVGVHHAQGRSGNVEGFGGSCAYSAERTSQASVTGSRLLRMEEKPPSARESRSSFLCEGKALVQELESSDFLVSRFAHDMRNVGVQEPLCGSSHVSTSPHSEMSSPFAQPLDRSSFSCDAVPTSRADFMRYRSSRIPSATTSTQSHSPSSSDSVSTYSQSDYDLSLPREDLGSEASWRDKHRKRADIPHAEGRASIEEDKTSSRMFSLFSKPTLLPVGMDRPEVTDPESVARVHQPIIDVRNKKASKREIGSPVCLHSQSASVTQQDMKNPVLDTRQRKSHAIPQRCEREMPKLLNMPQDTILPAIMPTPVVEPAPVIHSSHPNIVGAPIPSQHRQCHQHRTMAAEQASGFLVHPSVENMPIYVSPGLPRPESATGSVVFAPQQQHQQQQPEHQQRFQRHPHHQQQQPQVEDTQQASPSLCRQIYRQVAGISREDLLKPGRDGNTIVSAAVAQGNVRRVDALLDRLERERLLEQALSTANQQLETPLCIAVFNNHAPLVHLLVEKGSDVNVRIRGDSHHFNVVGQSASVNVHHFNVCSRDAHYSTLLHYVVQRGPIMEATLLHLLNARSIDIDARDSHGQTPLHSAVRCHGSTISGGGTTIDSKRVIYLLARRGALLNCPDAEHQKTPLHYAIMQGGPLFVDWFLGLVINLSPPITGQSGAPTLHEVLATRTGAGQTCLQLASCLDDADVSGRMVEVLTRDRGSLEPGHRH